MTNEKTNREQVIEQLNDGRVTPRYIVENTDIDTRRNAQYHLKTLRADRVATKICRGLYALEDAQTGGDER